MSATRTSIQHDQYEVTATDPKALTRPFTMRWTLKRQHTPGDGYEILESACVEGERGLEAILGREHWQRMAKAVRIHSFGDPSVLRYEDIPEPSPKAGEAVVRIDAAGVNFLDVYHRTGLYPIPLPLTLGQEAAGTVVEVGEGVSTVKAGDRVAWSGIFGSYAQLNAVPATGSCSCRLASRRAGRGGDAAGHDRALSRHVHLSAQAGRHVPRACGRRRRGTVC